MLLSSPFALPKKEKVCYIAKGNDSVDVVAFRTTLKKKKVCCSNTKIEGDDNVAIKKIKIRLVVGKPK